jgi:hypothetical protein
VNVTNTLTFPTCYKLSNYTLYKKAGFWLVNSRDTDNVLQILLQGSRWRVKTANTILQIPWKKVKSYANTPTWGKQSANSPCKAWICEKYHDYDDEHDDLT